MSETVNRQIATKRGKPLSMSLTEFEQTRADRPDLAQRLCVQGVLLGRVLDRAIQLSGRTPKELASEFDFHDSSSISRMTTGAAPIRFALLWSVEWLREPLVRALAESMGGQAHVQTVITFPSRRSA